MMEGISVNLIKLYIKLIIYIKDNIYIYNLNLLTI